MMKHHRRALSAALSAALLLATPAGADVTDSFLMMFKPLPDAVPSPDNELTEEKIALGQQIYHDKRFSIAQDISCNTCHVLDKYGTDNASFSTGHKGQKGGRSAPTVFNAALHIAQFWDGRAPTVEEQAKGPVLNPVEMGMPSADHVIKVIQSIPGYVESFHKAFPGESDPVNYDNFGKAIGAFERKLLTPSPWDRYLKGNREALSVEEKEGFKNFIKAGCVTCHNGPGVGGHMFQKLGLVKPWPELRDLGRYGATKQESDKHQFKVPSLRNITETGPFLHDGSVKELPRMVQLMAEHQLGKTLSEQETASIVTFLKSLKGDLPADYIKEPTLPPNGPSTPAPQRG